MIMITNIAKKEFIMAFCSKCGAQVQDGVAFCPECGNQLQSAQQPQQNYQQYQQPPQQQYQQYQQPPQQPQYATPEQDIQENKGIAWLAYLGFLFFIPLVARPQSKYCRFHANQGLVLLILEAVAMILTAIISAIIMPSYYGISYHTGTTLIITSILNVVVGVGVLVLAIMGIVNATGGKMKQLPLIGKITIIK